MNPPEQQIYNEAAAAALDGSRHRLAAALRSARRSDAQYHFIAGQHIHPSGTNLTNRIIYHATFVGWPIRLRPNGH